MPIWLIVAFVTFCVFAGIERYGKWKAHREAMDYIREIRTYQQESEDDSWDE